MPTYTVESPSGQTIEIEGDTPPTEQELDDIFNKVSDASVSWDGPLPSSNEGHRLNAPQPTGALGRDYVVPAPWGGMVTVNPAQIGQTVKNMGLEGGGATLGQIAGAPLAEFGGVQVGGAIGGFLGNTAAQLTTPGKDYSLGEALAAGAAGTVPGASLAKAGAKEVVKQGAKYAAANVLGKTIQTGVEEGRLPTGEEAVLSGLSGFGAAAISKGLDKGIRADAAALKASEDAVRRETLNAGKSLGLVVPPAAVNPNPATNTLQSIAGKAASAQEAILRNQPKINAAVREEIGLAPGTPLSPIAYNTARVPANLVYDRISKISPEAANLLEQFKVSNAQSNELYAAYRNAPIKDPALLAQAKAAETQADVFKNGLGKVIGPSEMKAFDEARIQLAKIGLAERATNFGDGNIDPKVLGDAFEFGERLTGNFKTIGRFQNAFGKYVQEASKTPPSGVDYLKTVGKFGAGGGLGYALGGPAGAALGTLGAAGLEKGAREAILSRAGQRLMANPNYGPVTADTLSELGRLGTMQAGRKPKSKPGDRPMTNYIRSPALFMQPL